MCTNVNHNYGIPVNGVPPLLSVPLAGVVHVTVKDLNDNIKGETTATQQGEWRDTFCLNDGTYVVEFRGAFRPIGSGFTSLYTKPTKNVFVTIVVPLSDEPDTVPPDPTIGPSGSAGPTGPMGPQGAVGNIGEPGEPGIPGVPGLDGTDGPSGSSGSQGRPGVQGSAGPPGLDGTPGAAGQDGAFGGYSQEFFWDSDTSSGYMEERSVGITTGGTLKLSYLNSAGTDVQGWIQSFNNFGSSTSRGILRLFKTDDPQVFAFYEITDDVTDTGIFWLVPAGSVIDSNGSFLENNRVVVTFTPAGSTGSFRYILSAGIISGGAITDNGDGTVEVASGNGYFRATNDPLVDVEFLTWDTTPNLTVTADSTRYVGILYNDGSPIVEVHTTDDFDGQTSFLIAILVNENDAVVHITPHEPHSGDIGRVLSEFLHAAFHIMRTSGLAVGETGTRNLTISAGVISVAEDLIDFPEFNTSTGSVFDAYYGSFTKVSGLSQWPNEQYDLAGTLTTMINNRYANLWVYAEPDGEAAIVYGTAQYVTAAQAEAASPPASVPVRLREHGVLIAQLVFQKSAGTATHILSPFVTQFDAAGVTDHNDLVNAGGTDSHTTIQSHLDAANPHSGSLANIVEDLSPQLGADLDVNGNIILNDATGDVFVRLADTIGATVFAVLDSDLVPQLTFDSSGNIVLSGTVDGRDVNSDGTAQDSHIAASNPHSGSLGALVDDPAPQLGADLDVYGWTVDGRDVAADGTKLDTIESSADVTDTANVTAALPVVDSTSLVEDPADDTKQMRIDVEAVATGTVRVLTMPDSDITLLKHNVSTSAPTVNNDNTEGYSRGSHWIRTTTLQAWICVQAATGNAIWRPLSFGFNAFGQSGDPTVNNDNTQGFHAGSVWTNTTASPDRVFILKDPATGAADWIQLVDSTNALKISMTFYIENPEAGKEYPVEVAHAAFTINKIKHKTDAGKECDFQLNIRSTPDVDGTDVFSSTITSDDYYVDETEFAADAVGVEQSIAIVFSGTPTAEKIWVNVFGTINV